MFKVKESTPNKANTLSRGKCQGIVFSGRGADKKHNANLKGLHSMLSDARIIVTSSITGSSLGGLLSQTRRLIAMPFMAFSFCAVSCAHGVALPKFFDGYTAWESLTGLLFSSLQSANLCGVALPYLAVWLGFDNKLN